MRLILAEFFMPKTPPRRWSKITPFLQSEPFGPHNSGIFWPILMFNTNLESWNYALSNDISHYGPAVAQWATRVPWGCRRSVDFPKTASENFDETQKIVGFKYFDHFRTHFWQPPAQKPKKNWKIKKIAFFWPSLRPGQIWDRLAGSKSCQVVPGPSIHDISTYLTL